ncbi:6358_t:CDS:2, partial [Dentiscutata erythropus]
DLESVHRKIVLLVESQVKEVRTTISSQHMKSLLQSLTQLYRFWTLHQQATVYAQLEELTYIPLTVVENLVINRPREKPVGAKNQKSVRRDPSAFEIAEKRPRQCSTCHQIGHNCQTCPNK